MCLCRLTLIKSVQSNFPDPILLVLALSLCLPSNRPPSTFPTIKRAITIMRFNGECGGNEDEDAEDRGGREKERSRFPSLPSWLSPFFIESAECFHICLRGCAELAMEAKCHSSTMERDESSSLRSRIASQLEHASQYVRHRAL